MARPRMCDVCGDDLAEGRYVICFYPWDEKRQDIAHADPFLTCCKHCFDDLRSKAVNDIYSMEGE